MDEVLWSHGVQSLVARCLVSPRVDGMLELDAECREYVAAALAAPGMFSAMSLSDEGPFLATTLVSDTRQFEIRPLIDGVWEFSETTHVAMAQKTCEMAASIGPTMVGYMSDTASEGEPVRLSLEGSERGLLLDGQAMDEHSVQGRVVDMLMGR